VQELGAPSNVNTAVPLLLDAALIENEQPLTPMEKLKFPSAIGVPMPTRFIVCSPFEVKMPLAENEIPFTVFELMEYEPMEATVTFIPMVLTAVSDVPTV